LGSVSAFEVFKSEKVYPQPSKACYHQSIEVIVMKFSVVFLALFVVSGTSLGLAQTRTITNADLERFREKRLQAEREYRENYARLGLPSPDELEEQRIKQRREDLEFYERLVRERLQRETFEAERAVRMAAAQPNRVVIAVGSGPYASGALYGFPSAIRHGRLARFPNGKLAPGVSWRAGGGGVIYEPGGRSSYVWTPARQTTYPVFRVGPGRPR
jgi:hypothetical protein